MTYLLYKDYLTGEHHIGYSHEIMNAKTDFEAIEEADKAWQEEGGKEKLYLMRIMKKNGKVQKMDDGWKKQIFTAVMCKRSETVGWHANDHEHYENFHQSYRAYKKDLEYFGDL